MTLQPALRWRMAAAAEEAWGRMQRIQAEHPRLVDDVREEMAERGPLTSREIEHEEERRHDHWGWNWSSVKTCLEWLFWTGEITAAGRNRQFERRYDLTERVIPAAVLAQPTPTRDEADVILVRRAAQALGIGTARCLADYFRISTARAKAAIEVLVETGELLPVAVPGWAETGVYLWHAARLPRRIETRALLSPFDSLVFERRRLEQLFGFHYRIEIYVPQAKRVHGYYVYPFLLDSELVARVDLKADRTRGVLRVNSAWLEAGADPDATCDGPVRRAGHDGRLARTVGRRGRAARRSRAETRAGLRRTAYHGGRVRCPVVVSRHESTGPPRPGAPGADRLRDQFTWL